MDFLHRYSAVSTGQFDSLFRWKVNILQPIALQYVSPCPLLVADIMSSQGLAARAAKTVRSPRKAAKIHRSLLPDALRSSWCLLEKCCLCLRFCSETCSAFQLEFSIEMSQGLLTWILFQVVVLQSELAYLLRHDGENRRANVIAKASKPASNSTPHLLTPLKWVLLVVPI